MLKYNNALYLAVGLVLELNYSIYLAVGLVLEYNKSLYLAVGLVLEYNNSFYLAVGLVLEWGDFLYSNLQGENTLLNSIFRKLKSQSLLETKVKVHKKCAMTYLLYTYLLLSFTILSSFYHVVAFFANI